MNNSDLFYEQAEYWNRINFGLRLAMLRNERGISARQLSLDLGYNKNYIYSIESGRNFPTMNGFFEICHYLDIDPGNFFRSTAERLYFTYFEEILEKLEEDQLRHLYQLAVDLTKSR